MDQRKRLLDRYHALHGRYVDGDAPAKAEWFRRHASTYTAHLPPASAEPEILELACGPGFLLAALRELGYTRLTGVDLSSADVEAARSRVPEAEVVEAEVETYLADVAGDFDVVIAKALFEHVPKERVIPLVRAVHDALRAGGVALIEVPNMDWILAPHERYMDFTHEVGFTRESLGQVLRTAFDDATVLPVTPTHLHGPGYRALRALLWPVLRAGVNAFLALAGGDGQHTLWQHRSILGVARAPDS